MLNPTGIALIASVCVVGYARGSVRATASAPAAEDMWAPLVPTDGSDRTTIGAASGGAAVLAGPISGAEYDSNDKRALL